VTAGKHYLRARYHEPYLRAANHHCYHVLLVYCMLYHLFHRALVSAFLGQLPSDSRCDAPQLTLPLHRVCRFVQRCGLIGAAGTTLRMQHQQQHHADSTLSTVHIRSMPVAEFDLVARECLATATSNSNVHGSSSSSSSELSLQLFCELLLKLALRRCSSGATSSGAATAAATAANSTGSTTHAVAVALYLQKVLAGAIGGGTSVTADVTARSTPDRAR
jgi:hypothetical protein